MTHMNNRYQQQRLAHCEDCGALYAQYVEHEYPQCDECLIGELDAVYAPNEWEALRRLLEINATRRDHPEQD